jgi:carboxylesterase
VHAAEDHLFALQEMCSPVFVAGLSMGALLTLVLGARYPQQVRGVVAINGGTELGNPGLAASAFRRDLPDVVPSWDEDWLLKDRTVVEVAYREMARTTICDLLGLAKAVEELLPVLKVPVLFLQSIGDGVVPPRNGPAMARRVGSSDKRVVFLWNSYHVATMDYDRDCVAGEVIGFVRAHS